MTAHAHRARILGTGYAVPDHIRRNDDPIFDWLREHQQPGQDLFKGYDERRVLGPGEDLIDLLVPAARRALDAARVAPHDVDLLLGDASVSEYITPNALAHLHARLELPHHAWILPIDNEFSNFNAGLVTASALIDAGRARHALIVCGSSWTRFVDYHTPPSISAADGAGAAVIGLDRRGFAVVDYETWSDTRYYGSMYMQPDVIRPGEYTAPYYHITERGQQGFVEFGERQPVAATQRLLERHRLTGADIALITHQASSVLNDAWAAGIRPAQYLQTLATLANMTVANLPVNLAHFDGRIEKDTLVLLGIGPDFHTHALLLHRQA